MKHANINITIIQKAKTKGKIPILTIIPWNIDFRSFAGIGYPSSSLYWLFTKYVNLSRVLSPLNLYIYPSLSKNINEGYPRKKNLSLKK